MLPAQQLCVFLAREPLTTAREYDNNGAGFRARCNSGWRSVIALAPLTASAGSLHFEKDSLGEDGMDLEKDNFEDDNELSGLEEEDELGGDSEEIVEVEEEELILGDEEPGEAPAPAPRAAPKPAAKPPAKKAAAKKVPKKAKKAAKPKAKKKAAKKPAKKKKR
jgi:hypothetical protein